MTDDEKIIRQRVRGRSARAIARAMRCTLSEVTEALDRFANATINDDTRKHSLALELERLDQLLSVFHARALEGDVPSGILTTKIIQARCAMLGLYTPPAASFAVIEASAPAKSSTTLIEEAIQRIRGKKSLPAPEPDTSPQ